MQVRSPDSRYRVWIAAALGACRVRSIAAVLWQLRHSRLLFAFSRAHSCPASSRRLSRNFCRVEMVPKSLPQTSLDACILRAILSVQSCGTWQPEQVARTPDRFEKCTVCASSGYTLSRISWQPVQNASVFVRSIAVLKPPQNTTPAANPPRVRNPRLSVAAGVLTMVHSSRPARSSLRIMRSALVRRQRVAERARHQWPHVGLRDMARRAEIPPRRHIRQHLAIAIHEMRDGNHRRAGALHELTRVAGQAAVGIQRELITVDRVRNDRRLLRIVP